MNECWCCSCDDDLDWAVLEDDCTNIWNFELEKLLSVHSLLSYYCGSLEDNAERNGYNRALVCEISEEKKVVSSRNIYMQETIIASRLYSYIYRFINIFVATMLKEDDIVHLGGSRWQALKR